MTRPADDTEGVLAPTDAPSDQPSSSGRRRPAVLFVDDGALAPFVQLAVLVQRFGYRTIRVTTARPTLGSALTRRVGFDRVLYAHQAELVRLDRLLVDEQVIDVQCSEALAVETYGALARLANDGSPPGWHHRADLVDKWNVVHLLDALGIAHPDALVGDTAPEDAVARLGLPIVVKPRVGAYGRGVLVAKTLDQLTGHLATLRPDEVLFESFIEGTPVNYCAVVGDGSERDMTYRTLRRRGNEWSPSIEIACSNDEELIAIGRRLAAALPCEGLMNVDTLRDKQGRYYVHDLNLRVWGALFASWSAGYDLTSAYLRWLADQAQRQLGPVERSARIFPDYAGTLWGSERRRGLWVFGEQLRIYRRLLGTRYIARELLRSGRWLFGRDRTSAERDRSAI